MVCPFLSTFSRVRTLPSTSYITHYWSLLCEAKQPSEVRLWDGSETRWENMLPQQGGLQIQVSLDKQGIWTQLLSSLCDVLTTKEHPYWSKEYSALSCTNPESRRSAARWDSLGHALKHVDMCDCTPSSPNLARTGLRNLSTSRTSAATVPSSWLPVTRSWSSERGGRHWWKYTLNLQSQHQQLDSTPVAAMGAYGGRISLILG